MTTQITALAQCETCGRTFRDADALEAATEHARAEQHQVKGARHTVLKLDMREDR